MGVCMTTPAKYGLFGLGALAVVSMLVSALLWSRLDAKNETIREQAEKLAEYKAQEAATAAAENAESAAMSAAKQREQQRANDLDTLRKSAPDMSDADFWHALDGMLYQDNRPDELPPARKPAD